MTNKLSKLLKRQRLHARRVSRENLMSTFLELKLCMFVRVSRRFHLTLSDMPATVRSAPPDLRVTLTNLGREVGLLAQRYPHDADGPIIDAGGYVGTAAAALARIYPRCPVVLIEPSSRNFEILSRNATPFANIRPIKAALVPKCGPGSIELMSRGSGEWGLTTITEPNDHRATFLEGVDTITVDDIMTRFGYDRVSVLKMDIEGGEQAFLSRSEAWLDCVDLFLVDLHHRIVGDSRMVRRRGGNVSRSVDPHRTRRRQSQQPENQKSRPRSRPGPIHRHPGQRRRGHARSSSPARRLPLAQP